MNESLIRRIDEYVEQNQEALYAELTDLIRYDTQNFIHSGTEEPCQRHVERRFADCGLPVQFYYPDDLPGILSHPDYLAGRGTDKRPNVCATLAGESPERVLLSAHTDTMPVGDPALWSVDPFGGLVRDGRVYGRGANDNKYGVAAMIFLARLFRELGLKPHYTYDLLAYVDEEFGGGNGALAGSLSREYRSSISLDSGNYELWVAALGGCVFELELKCAAPTDSSAALLDALQLVKGELDQFAAARRRELGANPLYAGSDMERSAFRYLDVRIGEQATNLDRATLQFVYYTDRGREDSLAELKTCVDRAKARLAPAVALSDARATTRFFHYLQTPPESGSLADMKACAEAFVDFPLRKCGACLSDLSLFLKWASPDSFGFGALRDFSLYGGAHQVDEFVDCAEFKNVVKALALFMLRHGAPPAA